MAKRDRKILRRVPAVVGEWSLALPQKAVAQADHEDQAGRGERVAGGRLAGHLRHLFEANLAKNEDSFHSLPFWFSSFSLIRNGTKGGGEGWDSLRATWNASSH